MKKILSLLCIAGVLAACNKVDIKAPDDFTVTTSSTTYTIRDTVKFIFTANPDQITFYSGEPNHNYANASRTSDQPDSTILTFSTVTTAPSATTQSTSVNNITVLASTDYSGILDIANIKKASWTDITARAKFATATTSVSSGNVHLEDLTKGSAPLYIAFKYVADTATAVSQSRKWTVTPLAIKSYFRDTTNVVAGSIQTAGFSNILSVLNPANTWSFANASLTFNAPAIGSSSDEDWAISRPMNLSIISSDLGVNIKNTTVLLSQYKYTFKKAGTYVVTFVGENVSSGGLAKTIRQITLNITN
ncbi:hypothetical protein BEL04_12265 [Mucilaginibacter sp. PPCGB 2223]|uniref:DUF5017 domain-containing protein n=1 Tax=Mucilaginibacter sp. PPCGB 2223 TaxID=1886027 RepID=UPI0008242DDB|nr:DUF5017 domain-containing protein [Mucilaginibacter sp. PPCGB 2223]OCX52247.1 hypothetical protein BEL04_12265 [Mucilaginibacter sp. PPCGB 2223]